LHDVYYLNNPETQLAEVPKVEFLERIRSAFTFLESAVDAGELQYYGVATWEGFRQEAKVAMPCSSANCRRSRRKLPVAAIISAFVQLPFNMGMTEALTLGNQTIHGRTRTVMEAASDLDITLIAECFSSARQVARGLPSFVADALGLHNDAERSLQFARSSPGITTALVGMSSRRTRQSQFADW